jgi:hypothetical protein
MEKEHQQFKKLDETVLCTKKLRRRVSLSLLHERSPETCVNDKAAIQGNLIWQ